MREIMNEKNKGISEDEIQAVAADYMDETSKSTRAATKAGLGTARINANRVSATLIQTLQ